jgi:hypothetical protein
MIMHFLIEIGSFYELSNLGQSTILGLVQCAQGFVDFTKEYTACDFGGKNQLTQVLNSEVLYSMFVEGNAIGLWQRFIIGLRAMF